MIEETGLALIDRVLDSARRWMGRPRRPQRTDTSRAHRDLAEAVRLLLAVRYSEPLSLDAIAVAVHSSPFHLTRLFAREVGVPIHRYRNRLRLRAALERLDEAERGETGLTRLALDLGYASHSHFSDAFRREFGAVPSEVRRSATPARLRELRKNLKA